MSAPFLTAEIKGTMDVALARINLRRQLLSEMQCSVQSVARSTVTLTALGELIMSTRPNRNITLDFIVVQPDNDKSRLEFACQINGDYSDDRLFARYHDNLKVVTDNINVSVDNDVTHVEGFIRIS